MKQSNTNDMKIEVGQYHYAPHYRAWGVWQYTEVSEDGYSCSATHIQDFATREEARAFVYKMNGWTLKK